MTVLVLFIQIVSLAFFFKFVMTLDSYTGDTEGWFWYFIAGLNILLISRFIYVQINFSFVWYDQIVEIISFGISLLIVIPTMIYHLIRRNRKQKRK